MRGVGSKAFGTYDEFKEAFMYFEKVISYDLKTMVLGYRLCVHNRVGSSWPRKLAFEIQAIQYETADFFSLWFFFGRGLDISGPGVRPYYPVTDVYKLFL